MLVLDMEIYFICYTREVEKLMKITFLGTAAATAMPLPFCNCNICRTARILKGKDIRRRASIVINDVILIDLSPDSINSCYQFDVDLSRIRYILQTHAHSDHFDAGHFITRHPDYAARDINPITLIASPKTLHAMNKMLKDEDGNADLFSPNFQYDLRFSIRTISYNDSYDIDRYVIKAFDSLHDINQESLVFLIQYEDKTILYGTDLLGISESVYKSLEKERINVLILDQTYGEGFNAGGHLDAGQLIEIVDRLRIMGNVTDDTLIFATHISHEGNDTHENMLTLAKAHNYNIAYDGLTVNL